VATQHFLVNYPAVLQLLTILQRKLCVHQTPASESV
jgi:hypothetical protein